MKRIIYAVIALLLLVTLIAIAGGGRTNEDFLRIHIRANSNMEGDQTVKYAVKTAIVDYLAPFLAAAHTKTEALGIVKTQLKAIEEVANAVLTSNGYTYSSNARLATEQFPTRTYDGVTLASGVYDALILELGSGIGNNWWCVVYPPLCFVGGEANGTNAVTFRWKLEDIIRQWFSENE
jgi:stage II sporulation protein R